MPLVDNDPKTVCNRIMSPKSVPILPGSTVTVRDATSIYNGYNGFVQRISDDRAAVLFEGGTWDKLVTLRLKDLQAV
ncbi:NAD(P)H dehydrogenase subunit NdhS [Synechococcus sp. M16CYN]